MTSSFSTFQNKTILNKNGDYIYFTSEQREK